MAGDDAQEAIETAVAWLDRWGSHVGACRGGDVCTCGLTRVKFELECALLPKAPYTTATPDQA